jgi:ketosteroid isomerase-like protein
MSARTPPEIHRLFEIAFNAGDLEAILALYEPAAVFLAGDRSLAGHEAIREFYRISLAQGARMKLETSVVVESADGLALLYGAWTLGPPVSAEGLSTEVVRREPNGDWKFVIDNPRTPR